MKYNKLVRDRIPQFLKDKGLTPITHIAYNEEYWKRLKGKLKEEVDEVLEDTNVREELADVLEVIYAICEYKGITKTELNTIRSKKLDERGGFVKRIVLEEA